MICRMMCVSDMLISELRSAGQKLTTTEQCQLSRQATFVRLILSASDPFISDARAHVMV